jgi:hypothetical protein
MYSLRGVGDKADCAATCRYRQGHMQGAPGPYRNSNAVLTCFQYLLLNNARVYLAARSPEKAEAAIAELKAETKKDDIHFLKLDLADLNSVKEGAAEFQRSVLLACWKEQRLREVARRRSCICCSIARKALPWNAGCMR